MNQTEQGNETKPKYSIAYLNSPKGLIFLCACFLIILGGSLLGEGTRSFSDENLFLWPGSALEQLISKKNVEGFFQHMNMPRAKPAYQWFNLIPTATLGAVFKLTGIDPRNQTMQIMFQLINILLLWLSFKVFLKIAYEFSGSNNRNAVYVAMIYILFPTQFLYIRHIQPYLIANLIGLYSILIFLRTNNRDNWTYYLPAILASLAFTIYPASLIYVFSILLLYLNNFITHYKTSRSLSSFFKKSGLLGGALLVPVLFFELLSRIGHKSYIKSISDHQKVMLKGKFSDQENSSTFLFDYFSEVTTFSIIAFLVILIVGSFLLFKKKYPKPDLNILILVLSAILFFSYFLYSTLVTKTAGFYGRIAFFFIPYLCFLLLIFTPIATKFFQRMLLLGVVISALGVVSFRYDISKIVYPRDVLYSKGIYVESVNHLDVDYKRRKILAINPSDSSIISVEESKGAFYASPPPLNPKSNYPYKPHENLTLVNFCELWPLQVGISNDYKAPDGSTLIYSEPHFINFPAYYYEYGFKKKEIEWIKLKNFQVKIFKLNE